MSLYAYSSLTFRTISCLHPEPLGLKGRTPDNAPLSSVDGRQAQQVSLDDAYPFNADRVGDKVGDRGGDKVGDKVGDAKWKWKASKS